MKKKNIEMKNGIAIELKSYHDRNVPDSCASLTLIISSITERYQNNRK